MRRLLPAAPRCSQLLPKQSRECCSLLPVLPGGLRPGEQGAERAPAALEALADRLARLRPDWRDQSRFYDERSELAAELRRIAAAARTAR